MGQFAERGKPQETGRPFDRVYGPEDLVDLIDVDIRSGRLDRQKLVLDVGQVFA